MDPLFERRELTRTVHIEARYLQRNIQVSLTTQLRSKYEGKCVAEGYIARDSLAIVNHSLGRTNLIKGGLDYSVQFQADVCFPHKGQQFTAPVVLKSKIGLHAEITPIKVLLPRDLHIGNKTFDDVKEAQSVTFEVVGSQFQQGDEHIYVLGKLLEPVKPATLEEQASAPVDMDMGPLIAAPTASSSEGSSEKKVVTVDMSATKASEAGPRRTRIKPKTASSTNEPISEGKAEGKS